MTLWIVGIAVAIAVAVLWIEWRYPLQAHPRYKFNALLPKLLGTGAVTCLGWCFVAGAFIRSHHRAHEMAHHNAVVRLGRWRHLWFYVTDFLRGLAAYKLERVTSPSGRVYLRAYYDHPEEVAARAYADANATTWPTLGTP